MPPLSCLILEGFVTNIIDLPLGGSIRVLPRIELTDKTEPDCAVTYNLINIYIQFVIFVLILFDTSFLFKKNIFLAFSRFFASLYL